MTDIAVIDFETEAIEPRPHYPPEPVGVSIILPGCKPEYLGFGHRDGNAGDRGRMEKMLKSIWKSDLEVACHNAKFDLAVCLERLGLPMLPWHRIHDTMILAFLADPYSPKLNLKHLANRYLKEPPEERDELIQWLRENVPEVRRAPTQWFRYMREVPVKIAGHYANGDTLRTQKLLKKFLKEIKAAGMMEAYNRERRLLPILMDMELRGVPVDVERLDQDVACYNSVLERVDSTIRKRLKAPSLDLNKAEELANALERNDLITSWTLTPKGKRATSADALKTSLKDQGLAKILDYRGILSTALHTFMEPWLETAQASKVSRIYTNWNQVRQDYHASGGGGRGTKTGRLSSNPNFQNIISVENAEKFEKEKILIRDAILRIVGAGRTLVPNVRGYIVPPKKRTGVIYGRDYSQQEFRMLGHYEDGPLKQAYLANPKMDVHETARITINEMLNREFKRKPVKNTGFGLIYGMGMAKLAMQAEIDVHTAKLLKKTYLKAFPGLGDLIELLDERAQNDEPIRTWGGRLYYCEEPVTDAYGHTRTFEYRLINTLIQGSSADVTKEAMIRYYETDAIKHWGHELYLTVHDELTAGCCERRLYKDGLECMRQAMESIEVDVPMLSEGKFSFTSWGDMKEAK